jgi:hypothetical protein
MDTKMKDDLERLAETTRKAGRDRVEAEYAETMRSIVRLFEAAKRERSTPNDLFEKSVEERATPRPNPGNSLRHSFQQLQRNSNHHSPAGAVRDVIQDMEKFSNPEIKQKIDERYPNLKIESTAISSVLNKLTKSGKIEIVTKGTGRNPHVYQKVGSN